MRLSKIRTSRRSHRTHTAAQVLRRHGVIGFGHLDMAVAMDGRFPSWKKGNRPAAAAARPDAPPPGKSLHLAADRAVKTLVGHAGFPLAQVMVLFLQAGEDMALQAVLLDIGHAALDLAFMPGHVGFGRKRNAVVGAERLDLGIDFGVKPVGPASPPP